MFVEAFLICERRSVCNSRKFPAGKMVSATDKFFGSSYIRDSAF